MVHPVILTSTCYCDVVIQNYIERLSKGESGGLTHLHWLDPRIRCVGLFTLLLETGFDAISGFYVLSKQRSSPIFFQLLLCCTFETELDINQVCVNCCPFFLPTLLAVCDLRCFSPGYIWLVSNFLAFVPELLSSVIGILMIGGLGIASFSLFYFMPSIIMSFHCNKKVMHRYNSYP